MLLKKKKKNIQGNQAHKANKIQDLIHFLNNYSTAIVATHVLQTQPTFCQLWDLGLCLLSSATAVTQIWQRCQRWPSLPRKAACKDKPLWARWVSIQLPLYLYLILFFICIYLYWCRCRYLQMHVYIYRYTNLCQQCWPEPWTAHTHWVKSNTQEQRGFRIPWDHVWISYDRGEMLFSSIWEQRPPPRMNLMWQEDVHWQYPLNLGAGST